ncbi:metalloregulator ArsR/SmtB family transcription factor [Ammoniphilus sp. CFH 90114]|uniref:ArsR/SmtB family transcription factor n=1 Tax=Ammoniphilus sp. CFH 90114 TaxID=2493665 RepID=UPI00100E6FF8|nr:metalloregulator ArsR/SmtB family transcription factor [Ammoniphilus sp. CFH 90114]RXT03904.1 transcriptional regulator [Ammoniphilus sp. CFH 90114]
MTDGKNERDLCEIFCYDEEKVSRIKVDLEKQDTLSVAKIFKALADDTRIKIAYALSQEGELCVCDAANIVGCTMATASHHLRLLRNMGLAKYRKEGKLVFYSLDDDHVRRLIQLAFIHSNESSNMGMNQNV